jgi:hypothetical protein
MFLKDALIKFPIPGTENKTINIYPIDFYWSVKVNNVILLEVGFETVPGCCGLRVIYKMYLRPNVDPQIATNIVRFLWWYECIEKQVVGYVGNTVRVLGEESDKYHSAFWERAFLVNSININEIKNSLYEDHILRCWHTTYPYAYQDKMEFDLHQPNMIFHIFHDLTLRGPLYV